MANGLVVTNYVVLITSIIRNNNQIVFSDYKNLHLTINFKIVSYNEYVGVKYLGDISKVKDNYIDFSYNLHLNEAIS